MEIRQNLRRVPALPIVLVMTVLAVLALALTTWFALARNEAAPRPVVNRPPVTTVSACSGLIVPDAIDRCERQIKASLSDLEVGHFH